jgi:prepilin-type N-terminal cleavage/methylation domain-containing protein
MEVGMFPSLHQQKRNGFSIIEVLVAVSIAAVLVIVLTMLYGRMSAMALRSNLNRTADNLVRYMQDVLDQPMICSGALVNSSNGQIVWPVLATPAPVDHIQVNGTSAIGPAGPVVPGSKLKLTGIFLRQPNPAWGEGYPGQQTDYQNGKTYNVTTAKVEFDFTISGGTLLGDIALQPKTADVVVALDVLSNKVAFCYQDQLVRSVGTVCNAAGLYTGSVADPLQFPSHAADCPGTPASASARCYNFYYVLGFDDVGKAVCACQVACYGP